MFRAKRRRAASPLVTASHIRRIQRELYKMNKKQEKMITMVQDLQEQVAECEEKSDTVMFPPMKKTFTMKPSWKQVSEILPGESLDSEEENCYGLDWYVQLERSRSDQMGCFLYCSKPGSQSEWMVEVDYWFFARFGSETRQHSADATFDEEGDGYGRKDFLPRECMLKAAAGDVFTLEVEVDIWKMEGFLKPGSFDRSQMADADARIEVFGEEFYVRKSFLASKSQYFDEMFFPESASAEQLRKREFTLNDCPAKYFQIFLEVLHGQQTLNDQNVSWVLHATYNSFKSPDVMTACEKYLLFESKLFHAEKFKLARLYELSKLVEKCISEIKTVEEIRLAREWMMGREDYMTLIDRMLELHEEEVKARDASVPSMD